MTELHLHILDKIYPAQDRRLPSAHVIKDFHLDIHAHEFVCLVGPSGCGKTTLLNIIAGLDNDYLGSVVTDDACKPKVGYVFQNPRLLPWQTVRQNIELAAPELPSHQLDAFLAAMQLDSAQHFYPERLSLGMSRRAAIIRAFAIDPHLLLMDEPLVSLDGPTARQVRQLLLQLWQQRPHTILYVTHDIREAIALADRLIFLSSHPMKIVAEIEVSLSRDERSQDHHIECFRHELIDRNPAIKTLL